MATFTENIFLIMTREDVAEVITYCKKNDIFYKTRLAELGIPAWKFYDSKSRYALEQESSEAKGDVCRRLTEGLQNIAKIYSVMFENDDMTLMNHFF